MRQVIAQQNPMTTRMPKVLWCTLVLLMICSVVIAISDLAHTASRNYAFDRNCDRLIECAAPTRQHMAQEYADSVKALYARKAQGATTVGAISSVALVLSCVGLYAEAKSRRKQDVSGSQASGPRPSRLTR